MNYAQNIIDLNVDWLRGNIGQVRAKPEGGIVIRTNQ